MTTDTTERGLERLICTALAGHPCDPPGGEGIAEEAGLYGPPDGAEDLTEEGDVLGNELDCLPAEAEE